MVVAMLGLDVVTKIRSCGAAACCLRATTTQGLTHSGILLAGAAQLPVHTTPDCATVPSAAVYARAWLSGCPAGVCVRTRGWVGAWVGACVSCNSTVFAAADS